MEYIILKSWGYDEEEADMELEYQVNNHIAQGWRPLGGVSIASGGELGPGGVYMAQAMTRE